VFDEQREKYYGDRSRSQLVRFALEHVRSQVIELWSGNYQSRIHDEDDPKLRRLPWLITFCGKNDGKYFLELFVHVNNIQ
jgi:hypothetical protein